MKVKITKFYKTGQRIDVKIDPWDTWNMDHTLAHIILPMLIQLKNNKHGVPGEFADVGGSNHDFQESFEFYQESHDAAFEKMCERWDEVMDKMIWSFSQLVDDRYPELYHHGAYDVGNLGEESESRWYDSKGHDLHQKRIQEGLDLFAKYYLALWD